MLARVELLRVNDRVLDAAGMLAPADLRSLDAIHLASAEQLGVDLRGFVTYDERLASTAEESILPSETFLPGAAIHRAARGAH